MPITPVMRRSEVYDVLDTEREYQNAGKGNAKPHPESTRTGGNELTPGEGLLCMEHLLAEARKLWYTPTGQTDMMPFIRKATAVGVQLMENYGCPPRKP